MKKNFVLLASFIVTIILLTSCNPTEKGQSSRKQIIHVAGSTTVAPVIKTIKEYYERDNNVSIEVQETGSTAGITATIEKIADIGLSSREITEEELESGIKETIIAIDAISVIVNPNNIVSDLSEDEIRKIFKGEITNWAEVGGENNSIIVISREEGSGTRSAFEELLKLEEKIEVNGENLVASLISRNAIFENGQGAIKANVSSSINSIGYISLGVLDDNVNALKVNGVECTEENVKNETYQLARPFVVVTQEDNNNEYVNNFISYILSEEAQNIISQNNYIKVN